MALQKWVFEFKIKPDNDANARYDYLPVLFSRSIVAGTLNGAEHLADAIASNVHELTHCEVRWNRLGSSEGYRVPRES